MVLEKDRQISKVIGSIIIPTREKERGCHGVVCIRVQAALPRSEKQIAAAAAKLEIIRCSMLLHSTKLISHSCLQIQFLERPSR